MSAPGEVMSMWLDSGVNGWVPCVLIATNRHHREFDRGQAVKLLAEARGETVESVAAVAQEMTWFSHTAQREREGCYGECSGEAGSYCSEGDGKAWQQVLYVAAENEL